MGLKRRRSVLVEAVDAAHEDILKSDANTLREQILILGQGTGATTGFADVSGLFLADISVADGSDVAGE